MISYLDVIKFISEYDDIGTSLLKTLENRIIKGRDRLENPVPVYLTKWRIKSTDSTYIKIKRNNIKNLKEITDIAGLRIICLFEQDIIPTHQYILEILKSKYDLEEFKLINFEQSHKDKVIGEILKVKVKEFFPKIKPKKDLKISGYKSIHYIVKTIQGINKEEYKIEIQLRTLFQDAWAELEHKLAYKKGYVHPHITNSFNILAKDLENNDSLISHLRDISNKEDSVEKFSFEKIGPLSWFGYPEELVPEEFLKDDDIKAKYNNYTNFIKNINPRQLIEEDQIKKAWELYNDLTGPIQKQTTEKQSVKYWIDMEKAYLYFCEGNYSDAENIYNKFCVDYPDLYIVNFRLGEINLIRGEIAKSLVKFDEAEHLLTKHHDFENQYRVKVKLGYIYWYLGEDFIDIVINKIGEAKKIFYEHQPLFKKRDYQSLANNLSYYFLERYIINNRKFKSKDFKSQEDKQSELEKVNKLYRKALNEFKKLEKYLTCDFSSNFCDTASWFYYHRYLKENKIDFLKKALIYAGNIFNLINYSTFSISSLSLQIKHVQDIFDSATKANIKFLSNNK